MPLDGLRAWIADVERKLDIRTRVFLVMATIAIGAAGAGIYLAVDTRNGAVSKSDVQALQAELEGRFSNASEAGSSVTSLEAEVKALQAQVQTLEGEDEAPTEGGGEESGGTKPSKPQSVPKEEKGASVPKTQGEVEETIEKAREEAKASP